MKKQLAVLALVFTFAANAFAANDYLVVDRSKQAGNQLVSAAENIREIREKIDKLNDAVSRMHDGSDYTTVEAQFGLASGKGANFVTLLALIHTIFNSNGAVAGADRLSQIDEFVARLSAQ